MSNTTTDITREIKYSRADRDYACYVNGQYIGSRANYSDAETLCDQVAYDLIADGLCATAAELDGGSEPDAMVADHAVVAPVCATCGACPDCDPIDEYADEYVPFEPFPVDALLDEADAALSHCPGAFESCGTEAHPSYAPFCQRCARVLDRLAVEAYIQRLAEDAGLACSFCGEAHDAAECPLRRPLVVPSPRACGCCGGAHHIQQCGELRAALFSEVEVFYAVAA